MGGVECAEIIELILVASLLENEFVLEASRLLFISFIVSQSIRDACSSLSFLSLDSLYSLASWGGGGVAKRAG